MTTVTPEWHRDGPQAGRRRIVRPHDGRGDHLSDRPAAVVPAEAAATG